MKQSVIIILLAYLMLVEVLSIEEKPNSPDGYKLDVAPGYLIVSPRVVRPNQEFRVFVDIYKMFNPIIRVTASLSVSGTEYASSSAIWRGTGAKTILLSIPMAGLGSSTSHNLTVEGVGIVSDLDIVGQILFRNDTNITYASKYNSILVQMEKPIYMPETTVSFRIISVSPDLQYQDGTLTVYALDAKGFVARRWLNQQFNMGIYENSFDLSYPVNTGTWQMLVEAFGHKYFHEFGVEFFYERRWEVNVTMPQQIFTTEWGLTGSLYAEHTIGHPAQGNGTLILSAKRSDGTVLPGELRWTWEHLSQEVPFHFSMQEMTDLWGDLGDLELHAKAWVYDWFFVETQNGTAMCRVVEDGVRVTLIGNQVRTFRPGVPFTIYYAVSRPDGSPYKLSYDRQLVITTTHIGGTTSTAPEEKVVIPDDAVVRYTVTPRSQDTHIRITASHSSGAHVGREVNVFRYYSKNEHYISVSSSTENPQVDRYAIFTVRTNVHVETIDYMVVSGGSLLMADTLQMTSRQKTFSIACSRRMAPSSRLIVFFVKNGEVVSDSLNFPVQDVRLTSMVSVNLNLGKDLSYNTLELHGRGPGGGRMYFAGVDYLWYERGLNNLLHPLFIEEELLTYDEGNELPQRHIWHYDNDHWQSSVMFPSHSSGMDAEQTFRTAGLLIFSDMNLTDVPADLDKLCNKTLGQSRCPNGQCYDTNKRCDGIFDCADGFDETGCPLKYPPKLRPPNVATLHRQSRFYGDLDWLWKDEYVLPHNNVQIVVPIPLTMDAYVISAFEMHPTEGLLLSNNIAQFDTTSMFFFLMEMPENSRRGEQLGIRLTLFNFQEETIEVLVTLHGSDDYQFVNVEEGGRVSSYAPRTTKGDIQIMVLMYAGEIKYVHFPIVPTFESGETTVAVSAYTAYDSDTHEMPLSVTYDGIENYDYTPYLIDLVNQGSVIIPDLEIIIPDQFFDPQNPRRRYVPGSPAAQTVMFGDVVTPGYEEGTPHSADDAGVPNDSSLGYMFDFAINLQTLDYLSRTNALDPINEGYIVEYMNSILMRQYTYIETNGAIKMFRRLNETSIWAGSFVCYWLHASLASLWSEIIYIPSKTVDQVAIWLANQQQPDGSYIESGTIYDRSMEPVILTRQNDVVEHEAHIMLTSNVLITLTSLTRLTGSAGAPVKEAVIRAADYLSNYVQVIEDPLQMATLAYALHSAGHYAKDDAFLRLDSMKRETEFIYWSAIEVEPNPEQNVDGLWYLFPRPEHTHTAHAVTATSYALMLYIAKTSTDRESYNKYLVPIMKFINSQRNAIIQFSSSQDTILALQALTGFSLSEPHRTIYNMEVDIQNTMSGSWLANHYVNATNFANMYTDDVPVPHGSIRSRARGTGYAILQLEQYHHVEYTDQVANPDFDPPFYIDVVNSVYSGKNFSNVDMTVCSSWTMTDLAPRSGMAVITVAVPTGYMVNRDTIEKLHHDQVPGLRRVRFRDGTLIAFFDYLDTSLTCFEFRMERWYPVANTSIQHLITVMEYSETGLHYDNITTHQTLHHLHICQVCGSYQCPYCPYYNAVNARIGLPRCHSLLLATATVLTLALASLLSFRIR